MPQGERLTEIARLKRRQPVIIDGFLFVLIFFFPKIAESLIVRRGLSSWVGVIWSACCATTSAAN
jgi:hypothetical protein